MTDVQKFRVWVCYDETVEATDEDSAVDAVFALMDESRSIPTVEVEPVEGREGE